MNLFKNKILRIYDYFNHKYWDFRWWLMFRKHRKNHKKYTDPKVGCGLYGVPCYNCPNYIKCWLR